jgi:hypothetical protein
MARTYDLITNAVLTVNATNLTISSIPATYTDLRLSIAPIQATAVNMKMYFNGDTTNYYQRHVTAEASDGTSAPLTQHFDATHLYLNLNSGGNQTSQSMHLVDILSYRKTDRHKSGISRHHDIFSTLFNTTVAPYTTSYQVFTWSSTAAINSITLENYSGTLKLGVGTRVSLYGIKAA